MTTAENEVKKYRKKTIDWLIDWLIGDLHRVVSISVNELSLQLYLQSGDKYQCQNH